MMSKAETSDRKMRDPFKAPDVRAFALDGIELPQDQDTQLLAGVIFAEASPNLTEDNERYAIGWAFVNWAMHTHDLKWGLICPALQDRPKQMSRTKQVKSDSLNLGDSILASIRSGSAAYQDKNPKSRWNLVIENDALRPIDQLKAISILDIVPLRRAILVAVGIRDREEKKEENKYVMRFNKADNSPPRGKGQTVAQSRFEKLMRKGAHTFYEFKTGRECG